MTLSAKIADQIEEMPFGTTFGYKDLAITSDQYVTAAKVLERLQKKDILKKVANGKFYKPKQTVFGELKPTEEEILKTYLFKDGKRIAYITGTLLYNQMGLTRQVASAIKIASRGKRIYIQSGTVKATPVKSYVEVTDLNYKFLGLLDALKDVNKIPDFNPESGVVILGNIIRDMTEQELESVIKCALVYPPRVRAILGALMEISKEIELAAELMSSLNPFSQYKTRLTNSLSTAINWNLI